MGHKWMWNPKWNGLPPQSFLSKLDPLFDGIRNKLAGDYLTSDHLAGHLAPRWAEELGLRAGIPVPVGAFDAHWSAIGSQKGDVVNVAGASTCIIAMSGSATDSRRLWRGAGKYMHNSTASRQASRRRATFLRPSRAQA